MTEEELEPFQDIKPASLIYTQDFETPYLPSGFNLKLSLISNWGDPDYIGFNKISIYDQNGFDILQKNTPRIIQLPVRNNSNTNNENIDQIYFDPENLIKSFFTSFSGNSNNINNSNQEYLLSSTNKSNKLISNLNKTNSNPYKNNNNFNKYWIADYNDISKIDTRLNNFNNFSLLNYNSNSNNENNININFDTLDNKNSNTNNMVNNPSINTFSNFNNNQNLNNSEYYSNNYNNSTNQELNTLYFIFDKLISISFIEIFNLQDKPERGIKEVQIALDENIIYKGNLKKFHNNYEKTTILFSSDNKITKLINLKTLNKANLKNGYIYKQINKTISECSNIANNFSNNFDKISTAYNNNNNNMSPNNFSPTFNINNNLSNNINNNNSENEFCQVIKINKFFL
jgi:hypothetical protein